MNSIHQFLIDHHLAVGLLGDALTFFGALVLARDAFRRLKDLNEGRVYLEFELLFPKLKLPDKEVSSAKKAVRTAMWGFRLLLIGFLMQAISRFGEP